MFVRGGEAKLRRCVSEVTPERLWAENATLSSSFGLL